MKNNKHKLIEWIFSIINKECSGNSFADVFAGTGVVSAVATKHFKKVLLNDLEGCVTQFFKVCV
jgi:adenine-specific DNA-methyltransferase